METGVNGPVGLGLDLTSHTPTMETARTAQKTSDLTTSSITFETTKTEPETPVHWSKPAKPLELSTSDADFDFYPIIH